jgi:hypothetical protein
MTLVTSGSLSLAAFGIIAYALIRLPLGKRKGGPA